MSSDRERRVAKWRRRAMDLCGTTVLLAVAALLLFWRLQS
jgi:hypothetical protein